jgi:hypothetical protein
MPLFEKGKPRIATSGRRAGTPNKRTERERAQRAVEDADARAIVAKVVEDARAGDQTAQALYFRYLKLPPPRFVPAPVGLTPPTSAREAVQQIAEMVARVGEGAMDFESAHALIEGLKAFVGAYDVAVLESEVRRIRELGPSIVVQGGLPDLPLPADDPAFESTPPPIMEKKSA